MVKKKVLKENRHCTVCPRYIKCCLDGKSDELFLLFCCSSETPLDFHIPNSIKVGGQSAYVCLKGRGVGETHAGFARQHAAQQHQEEQTALAAGTSLNIRGTQVQRLFRLLWIRCEISKLPQRKTRVCVCVRVFVCK